MIWFVLTILAGTLTVHATPYRSLAECEAAIAGTPQATCVMGDPD